MKQISLYIILLFCGSAILPGTACYAQKTQIINTSSYDFLPREKVVFEDDFSQDALGSFPSKWRRFGEGASRSPEHCQIKEDNNVHVLETSGIISDIEPDIDSVYIPDSFTLEYDFMLGVDNNINSVDADFRGIPNGNMNDDCFFITGNGTIDYHNPSTELTLTDAEEKANTHQYPEKFTLNTWHHAAITSKKTAFKMYVDQYCILTVPPHGIGFSSFAIHCSPPGKVKNIRLATGKQINLFSKLSTDKKFVTTVIHFDVDKSEIKPESMGYVMELARFLKANSVMKLEIDGHTDSDGNAVANMKLSQDRADEVRKQLVTLGIASDRLTSRGFGATRPIKPNTSPEGKNSNRRVEFVKM